MVKQIYFKHRKAAPAIFNNALVENYKENFDAGQISVEKKRCYNPVEITGWKFHGKYSYGSFSRPIKRMKVAASFSLKKFQTLLRFAPGEEFNRTSVVFAFYVYYQHYTCGSFITLLVGTSSAQFRRADCELYYVLALYRWAGHSNTG